MEYDVSVESSKSAESMQFVKCYMRLYTSISLDLQSVRACERNSNVVRW